MTSVSPKTIDDEGPPEDNKKKPRGLFKRKTTSAAPPTDDEVKKLREQLRDSLTKMEEMKQQRESARRQALEMSHVFRALQSITIEYDRVELDDDADIEPQAVAMKNLGAKVLAIRAHQQRLIHENNKLQKEKEVHEATIKTQESMIGSLQTQVAASQGMYMGQKDEGENASLPSAPVGVSAFTPISTLSSLTAKFDILSASQDLHNRQVDIMKINTQLKDELMAKGHRIAYLEARLEHYVYEGDAGEKAGEPSLVGMMLPSIEEAEESDDSWDEESQDELPPPPTSAVEPASIQVSSAGDDGVEISVADPDNINVTDMSYFTDDSTINSKNDPNEPSMRRTRYHFEFGKEESVDKKSRKGVKRILSQFASKSAPLKKRCEQLMLERDILFDDLEKMDDLVRTLQTERDTLRKDNKFMSNDLNRTRDHFEKLVACHNDEKTKAKKFEKEVNETNAALDEASVALTESLKKYQEIETEREKIFAELTDLRGKHEDLASAQSSEKQMTEEKLAKMEKELEQVSEKAFIAKAKQEQRSLNVRDVIYHYKQLQRQHKYTLTKLEELEAEHCITLQKLDEAQNAAVVPAQVEDMVEDVSKDKESKPRNQFLQQLQDDLQRTTKQKSKLERDLKTCQTTLDNVKQAKIASEQQLRQELEKITGQMEKELANTKKSADKAQELCLSKEEDLSYVFKHMEQMSQEFESAKSKLEAFEANKPHAKKEVIAERPSTELAPDGLSIHDITGDDADSEIVETVDLTVCLSDDESDSPIPVVVKKTSDESRLVDALRASVQANERFNRLKSEYEKALAKLEIAERKVATAQREAEEAKNKHDARAGSMRDAIHRYKTMEAQHAITLTQMEGLKEEASFAKREARLAECQVKNTRKRFAVLNGTYQALTQDHYAAIDKAERLEKELTISQRLILESQSSAADKMAGGVFSTVGDDKDKLAKENVEMKAFCEEMLQLIEEQNQ